MKKQSGKKLVEILAVELKEWPKEVVAYFQWASGEVFATSKGIPTGFGSGLWYVVDSSVKMAYGCPLYDTELELAVDHDTAIVTRSQWEAERAKLSKPKANAQAWIRHRGRKNPFDVCTLVDARLRSGDVVTGKFSDNLKFVHTGGLLDVMAYRVNESVDSETPEVTEPVDGPLQWRDRVTEIDREVEALEEERASLIQKLADEGLQLLRDFAIKDLEPAGQPDMSDWCNWQIGDLLEVVKKEFGHKFQIGEIVRMKSLPTVAGGQIKCEYIDSSGWWWLNNQELKFHSRPAK